MAITKVNSVRHIPKIPIKWGWFRSRMDWTAFHSDSANFSVQDTNLMATVIVFGLLAFHTSPKPPRPSGDSSR